MVEFLHISWEENEIICKKLAKRIKEYEPEVLVGISRGGLVPVRLFSDYLNNHNVGIMRIEFYTGINKTSKAPKITQPLSINVKGKKVLLVDDVSDTGKSLKAATEYVKGLGAKEVRSVTLHFKPKSILKPDYYDGESDAWIIYPWEKKETKRKQ